MLVLQLLPMPETRLQHLVKEKGCDFSKKEGRKCWYSHDLTKAGLPLHNKGALKVWLILAEAFFYDITTYEGFIAGVELEKERTLGAIEEEEYMEKTRSGHLMRTNARNQWLSGREKAAKKILERMKGTGKIDNAENPTEKPVVDVTGFSGADILRLCGVENPFGRQKMRTRIAKRTGRLSTDTLDGWETEDEWSEHAGMRSENPGKKKQIRSQRLRGKLSGCCRGCDSDSFDWLNPYSEANMHELACQGIKPWDAEEALMMLSGGF
ncbi:MAG: hypothetical protein Q9218_006796 [Villophora microphyllina]